MADRPGTGRWRAARGCSLLLALACGCQSTSADLGNLPEGPPLDYSVLVTGGAFVHDAPGAAGGTFGGDGERAPEPIPIADILGVLRDGVVFRRVAIDADPGHRAKVLRQLPPHGGDPELLEFLQRTRDAGHDLLLVVERLEEGAIDRQGVNGRWPVTLSTWFLLGVGMFIPDHTFESRANLRVTLRDLETGRVVHDPLLIAGAVELSLVERSNFLGVLVSILVPPFWVHDDDASVAEHVRVVTAQRLLVSLVRELKSEPTRARLQERAVATVALQGNRLLIDARESVTAVRLRRGEQRLDGPEVQAFEQALIGSMQPQDGRFVYTAELPAGAGGTVQVLVGTLSGRVTSMTLATGVRR